MEKPISAKILEGLPSVNEAAVDKLLAEKLDSLRKKVVVLDDDPTGVQTVHDVYVYTDWREDTLTQALAEDERMFFILTNSRAMTEKESRRQHEILASNLATAAKKIGRDYILISRSDSTLRGHYPMETQVLRQELERRTEKRFDGEIIYPFFKEGGRFTLGNIHYVREGERLIPAGQTEFAKDKSFGYTASYLPDWCQERSKGKTPADSVTCISLEDLRQLRIEKIAEQLRKVHDFGKVIVNSADYVDVKVFILAFLEVVAEGKEFIFRSAAAVTKVLGGVPDRPLLERSDLVASDMTTGGLVVVGSHTAKSTAQLKELLTLPGVRAVEFQSNLVLSSDEALREEIDRCVALEEQIISSGETAVCFTNRRLLTVENDTRESALLRSVKISRAVQTLVGRLKTAPSFIVAKGGITSSDIGTKALGVKRARVMGQIRPGIPVWQTGAESRFPGVPYVIFPGNVGTERDLRVIVQTLTQRR